MLSARVSGWRAGRPAGACACALQRGRGRGGEVGSLSGVQHGAGVGVATALGEAVWEARLLLFFFFICALIHGDLNCFVAFVLLSEFHLSR